jgi:hypothetical protein
VNGGIDNSGIPEILLLYPSRCSESKHKEVSRSVIYSLVSLIQPNRVFKLLKSIGEVKWHNKTQMRKLN